ncbi:MULTISPECIES: hypothetical protein [unclassified Polaribacter]|uniref:hypothetical protein n=1 Tax=unclassified Polaribacter TaxID=196858 RepID=UPI0011BE9C5A|nr:MULTISPECIES: hypothetical protein [unclassified Polaribacter]TXD52055.1 hypothetical protein ES043_09420 [Polaribacter sp. IC063]TXD59777.1 hypothetical protein ES044_08910 [Polaribacter sp. IC066]
MKNLIIKFTLLLIVFLGITIKTYSQNFSNQSLKKLESFEININKLDNPKVYNDFNLILKLEKKRRNNKTLGIVLTSFSIVSTTLGIFVFSQGKGTITNSIGGAFLGAGIVSGCISIPLFNSSKNKRKQRDLLIRKYQIN